MIRLLQAALAAYFFLSLSVANADNSDAMQKHIADSVKIVEGYKKSAPKIAEVFSGSVKDNFGQDIAVADSFYNALSTRNFKSGLDLIHSSSKKGVSLERFTEKVSQVMGFYGVPQAEKEMVWFVAGYRTSWLVYKVPTITVVYKTKLTGMKNGKTVSGHVKLVLTKDTSESSAKVLSFVLVPGKK